MADAPQCCVCHEPRKGMLALPCCGKKNLLCPECCLGIHDNHRQRTQCPTCRSTEFSTISAIHECAKFAIFKDPCILSDAEVISILEDVRRARPRALSVCDMTVKATGEVIQINLFVSNENDCEEVCAAVYVHQDEASFLNTGEWYGDAATGYPYENSLRMTMIPPPWKNSMCSHKFWMHTSPYELRMMLSHAQAVAQDYVRLGACEKCSGWSAGLKAGRINTKLPGKDICKYCYVSDYVFGAVRAEAAAAAAGEADS
jgi:hypothetical protein